MQRSSDAVAVQIAAPFLARLSSAGAVLCFHSLTSATRPSASDVHVPETDFREVVRAVGRVARWVPLAELVRRHRSGASTAGLVALTFDDAYASLADVLPTTGVPATVFVVSQACGSGAVYWWDRVDELAACLGPADWRAFEADCGLPAAFRDGQPVEFGPLRPLRQWMLAQYHGRWPAHLDDVLLRWETQAGATVRHRSMTREELVALTRTPGIDLGVHTATHPVLPLLSDDELAAEIRTCDRALSELTGQRVPVLAAPYGLYDERTVRIARASGMDATLTLAGTTLAADGPPDALPRFCQTRGVPVWRVLLQVSGVAERVRRWLRPAAPAYPALPSATS